MRLNADDLYGWELDRLAQDSRSHPIILEWSRTVLADSTTPASRRVLAVVLLGPDRGFGTWAQSTADAGEVNPEIIAALEKLARDPSDLVRFEAQFALLRIGRPVDPAALGALVAAQDEDSHARDRIGNFLHPGTRVRFAVWSSTTWPSSLR